MGPEHDRSMSPEALSSLFQQRPMRPLPKRRLRERLSPEVADTIEYPPASQNSSPLFLLPGIVRDERSSSVGRNYTVIRDPGYEGAPIANHEAGESDEEEVKRFASSKVVRRSHPEILIDGYDSFENTNNKKKRKIPTAGDNTLNGTHTLADITALGITATAGSPVTDNDQGFLVPEEGGLVVQEMAEVRSEHYQSLKQPTAGWDEGPRSGSLNGPQIQTKILASFPTPSPTLERSSRNQVKRT
ncbi:hypothetical protein HYQ46_002871 [Verticillium longisporum]|nr:hypothetical protein HYQ46_002871 [Verticillium longisporum]